jgi:Leucine-rich repeat (LRR) protein
MPSSLEILNLSHNLIKFMPEDVSRKLKNITTIDISYNKLESLENF